MQRFCEATSELTSQTGSAEDDPLSIDEDTGPSGVGLETLMNEL